MPREISEVISRRNDLSTFLVHLTKISTDRDGNTVSPKENLKNILREWELRAVGCMGMATCINQKQFPEEYDGQKVVCFTETPLEYLYLLIEQIRGRSCEFSPYGVAITKRQGRKRGVNPVWYLDMTPGHDWITNCVDRIRAFALDRPGQQIRQDFFKLTPFLEQMGTWPAGTKEFWWEREWRRAGNFYLPSHFIVIAPEEDIPEIKTFVAQEHPPSVGLAYISPYWGIEEIIAHLAGFSRVDIDRI